MENFFSGSLLILSKIKIDKNKTDNLVSNLLDFLEAEDFITITDIDYLARFIKENGHLFDQEQLEKLLHIIIEKEKYFTNSNLLEALQHCREKYHKGFSIKDESIFTKLMLGLKKHNQWNSLRYLYHLSDDSNREKVSHEIANYLKNNFDNILFWNACREDIIDYREYFDKYLEFVNANKNPTDPLELQSGKTIRIVNYRFNEFIEFIYRKGITLSEEQLNCFTNLIDYQRFLLNPSEFDFEKFEPIWLLVWRSDTYLTRFKKIPEIKERLFTYLKSNADKKLAGLYFEYFE